MTGDGKDSIISMKKKQPTMKDVARLAGVTQPTVSYVINGTAAISDEVKERVNKAIEELHYKPNYNAVALKTKKSHVIGIIVPDIANSYYSQMVSLMEKKLTKQGYTVLINSTGYKGKVETQVVKRLLAHNVEAFIVAYQFTNSECWAILGDSEKKVIAVEAGKDGAIFPEIEADNYTGAYTATKYLIEKGRKKIAYIGQNVNMDALRLREEGYIKALEEGTQREPIIYRTDRPGEKWQEGIAIGRKLIGLHIDGLLVSSDEIAVGILKTLLSSGVNIPEDISVIGYDDIPIAKLFIPELTSVAQPIEEICEYAVNMLFKAVAGENVESVLLEQKLVVRGTTP